MQSAYENGTEYAAISREENNAWLDYKRARDADKSHEEAMDTVAFLATKFAPVKRQEKPELATDRKYREMCESSRRHTVAYRDAHENPNGLSTEEALAA